MSGLYILTSNLRYDLGEMNPLMSFEVIVWCLCGGLILGALGSYFTRRDASLLVRKLIEDEIHTPDSSRYFYSEGYQERFEKGEPQKQLSKEFVREWLMDNGFQGKEGQQVPEMTDEIVTGISERYIELYEHITGETFVKENTEDIAARIEKNVTEWLTK